jgi:hypothetical protein
MGTFFFAKIRRNGYGRQLFPIVKHARTPHARTSSIYFAKNPYFDTSADMNTIFHSHQNNVLTEGLWFVADRSTALFPAGADELGVE